ncbi:hypothetical protein OAR97_02020 [Arcobacteraceae bacterium]|nr:hypothetical protein [Arcobacteraceae bacterium]
MLEKLKVNIISYIYNISKQPVKLHELLEANALFNEGMKLDGTRLGFRLRTGRAYLVFMVLIHIIIIPMAFLAHELFAILDCHASIIVAMVFTAFLFGIFNYFKDWTRDSVTRERIKQMWVLHFPHFPYSEFNIEVSNIYEKAKDDDIKNVDLERYILDNLSS